MIPLITAVIFAQMLVPPLCLQPSHHLQNKGCAVLGCLRHHAAHVASAEHRSQSRAKFNHRFLWKGGVRANCRTQAMSAQLRR